MRSRAFAIALVAALSLAAGGCGGSGGPVIDATADNPCTMVKAAEVKAGLRTVTLDAGTDKGVEATLQGERVCQFQGTDAQGRPSVLKVGLVTNLAGPLFDEYRAQHQSAAVVPKLGERAVWDDASSTLVVLDQRRVVTVLVFGSSVTDRQGTATTIATHALKRLG